MTSNDQQDSVGVQIANQIIDLANGHLEDGKSAQEIASGLRHAAANFSAFAFVGEQKLPKDPNALVEEFISFFEHYLGVHKPAEDPIHGLNQLIEQVKKDF